MKKLTALAAALAFGAAAFASVDGAKETKKEKGACCEKCKDGACKDMKHKDAEHKDHKDAEKKG